MAKTLILFQEAPEFDVVVECDALENPSLELAGYVWHDSGSTIYSNESLNKGVALV